MCLALLSAKQDSFFELAKAGRIFSKSLSAELTVSLQPSFSFRESIDTIILA